MALSQGGQPERGEGVGAPPDGPAPSIAPHHRLAFVVLFAGVAVLAISAWAAFGPTVERTTAVSGPVATTAAGPVPGTSAGGPSATSAAPAATPPSSTTEQGPRGPASMTLAFTGDLLPHTAVSESAARYGRASGKPYDFAPMLAPMAEVIGGADLAICHLEVPVAPTPEQVSGYPSFGAPPELVDAAKATGYDGCSTASNHTLDKLQAGVRATLDRLDAARLGHAGSARSAEEGARTQVYDVQGAKVAHLAYAYGFNGYQIPAEAPWSANQIDPARIRADAKRAREGGADLVVVSLHWGTEYSPPPSQYQRDIAGAILPSPDIDLVIGHHAHVVQTIGQVEGTYVVWGLGNQLANMEQPLRRDGLTVLVRAGRDGAGRWKVTGIEGVPTYQDLDTFQVLPVVATLADPATTGARRDELRDSYERTAAEVLRAGTPGITVAPLPR